MIKPLNIRFVQINQPHIGRMFLPYSAGLLEAYVKRHAKQPENYHFFIPIINRQPLQYMVQSLLKMDIVGFSTYTWNAQISLAIARELKKKKPEILIVFGGPHVPDRAERFLKQNPFIDICCHGEGERVFLNILERFPEKNWEEIAGISYIKHLQFVTHPKASRLKDINTIPSPYLNQTFEPLIQAFPQLDWIALWETNRGCPFSCTFCDWGSAIQSKIFPFEMERLKQELLWFAQQKIYLIFSCDANYGILKRDVELTHEIVKVKQQYNYPQSFIIQNTKNMTERAYQIQTSLNQSNLNPSVTLSLQSLNPDVLSAVKRDNISLETYRELQYRFSRDGVTTYTDILIGMPGETYDSFAEGVNTVIKEGQHHRIQFFNVYILPNAEMGQPEYQKKYQMKSVTIPYVFTLHEAEQAGDGIYETQDMLISTYSMTPDDWVKMRVFSWFTDFLHLHRKLLQIPFILLQNQTSLSYRDLIEWFMQARGEEVSLLEDIQSYLFKQAQNACKGQSPFSAYELDVPNQGKLNVWLETSDFIVAGLQKTDALDLFYLQSYDWLKQLLKTKQIEFNLTYLKEALELNQSLLKVQNNDQTFEIETSFNLWQFYQGILRGQQFPIKKGNNLYYRDWRGNPHFTVKVKESGTIKHT